MKYSDRLGELRQLIYYWHGHAKFATPLPTPPASPCILAGGVGSGVSNLACPYVHYVLDWTHVSTRVLSWLVDLSKLKTLALTSE